MSSTTSPTAEARSETLLAVSNVLKLGGSLLVTWGIAIGMRLVLPRFLGPTRFGTLTFADAFTAAFFVALGLGVDVYARKHVAVRPAHASDFFGGTLLLRTFLALGVLGVMEIVMRLTHRSGEVRHLVYLLAATQLLMNVNTTLAAFLHAKGRVGGMSIASIAAKLVWAGGLVTAILLRAPLWAYALAYFASELIKSGALYALARRHLGLVIRVDATATKAMVLASLPYYLNAFAITAYGKLDLAMLGVFGTDREVGWYAASGAIAALTLLLAPLIDWVLMPTFARAAARSRAELYDRVRWATAIVLGVAIPVSLIVSVGADVWVRLLFGAEFAPAALALRVLATTFVLTYVNIIYAMTLVMLERAWTLTMVSIGGLVVNVALNAWLIPHGLSLGAGGGGTACALALLGTELFVTAAMLWVVGRGAFDGPTTRLLAKSLAACAVVVVLDRLIANSLRSDRIVDRIVDVARLAIDITVYGAIAIASGALRARELAQIALRAVRRRQLQGG